MFILENLDNMVPDKWYSSYHYSHPPLVERLRAIQDREGGNSGVKGELRGGKEPKKSK